MLHLISQGIVWVPATISPELQSRLKSLSAVWGKNGGIILSEMSFEGVKLVAKANVYGGGKVLSHTFYMPDGNRKTLGIAFPCEYEFNTADAEIMEVISGELEIRHPGSDVWGKYTAGMSFDIPANSSFGFRCKELSEYVCSYIKG